MNGQVFDGIWENDRRKTAIHCTFNPKQEMPFDHYFAESMVYCILKYIETYLIGDDIIIFILY